MNTIRIPRYLTAAVAFCFATAAVASFAALGSLARYLNWPGLTWILFPLMVDTLSAAALVVWLKPGFPADARSYARKVALGSIAYSAVANAIAHAITGTGLSWTTLLAVLVGASPAIAAALSVELAIKITGPLRKVKAAKAQASPEPQVQVEAPKPEPVVEGSGKLVSVPSRKSRRDEAEDARLIAKVLAEYDGPFPISVNRVHTLAKVGKERAARLAADINERHAA